MIGPRDAAASRLARITSAALPLPLQHTAGRAGERRPPNFASDPEIAAFMARVEIVPDKDWSQFIRSAGPLASRLC